MRTLVSRKVNCIDIIDSKGFDSGNSHFSSPNWIVPIPNRLWDVAVKIILLDEIVLNHDCIEFCVLELFFSDSYSELS